MSLGLSVGPRPDLGFPGAWLYAGGSQAVLHMHFGRPMPTQRAGVIDLRAVKARFDARGMKYDLRQHIGAGTCSCSASTRTGLRWNWIFRCGGDVVGRRKS